MEKIKKYIVGLTVDLKIIFLKRPWWTILCLVMTISWIPLIAYHFITRGVRK